MTVTFQRFIHHQAHYSRLFTVFSFSKFDLSRTLVRNGLINLTEILPSLMLQLKLYRGFKTSACNFFAAITCLEGEIV